MIDRKSLLSGLRRELKRLEVDLAEQAESDAGMKFALEAEYRAAREAERIGESFNAWRGGVLTQAAVAWLLGCVFVRFTEDNGLVDDALIAGPAERNMRAADRQTLYFRDHPTDSDRDYLLDVFTVAAGLPGMDRLYDREHNPVWRYPISGDAARDLLAFWRAVDPDTGVLRHDFTDPGWDTRFLGDLYQDLSDDAKKRFALLQTPEFVEEFILDRTLTPALDEFGLAGIRLIDPACGSGHFLLGAFARLLRAWFEREPGTPERALAQRALDGVYGVDINPFAAAIATFRLLVAALRASRIARLKEAPNFQIHVAAGDSLLHGRRFSELDVGSGAEQLRERDEFAHAFQTEDPHELNQILGHQYHVVVGNPPYVTVKDPAVNALYRTRYPTCHMKYALSVPFTERFFDLALTDCDQQIYGHVGMITANSFMKREFGKKLIEELLSRVDLTNVVDTSGAYIPGHGTPTVILFGRHREPVANTVRCVMGIRGEPSTPLVPAEGLVWTAIVDQIDQTDSESEWINSLDFQRHNLHKHPWSLGGGTAVRLKLAIEEKSVTTLGKEATAIGFMVITGEDEVFSRPERGDFRRAGVDAGLLSPFVVGDLIRDWSISPTLACLYDYDSEGSWLGSVTPGAIFWPYRTTLKGGKAFGKTREERGLDWREYAFVVKDKLDTVLSITFAFVSTHNHFVVDHGGKVFKQSAPVIKLPSDTTSTYYLALVGLLNCSVACFWMKQTFHNKGSTVDAHGARQTTDAFENFYEFTGTGLKRFPIPNSLPLASAESLARFATERESHLPEQLRHLFPMTTAELNMHRDTAARLLARMISLQEELDWECYGFYEVIDEDCRYVDETGNQRDPPPLALGERAFEIIMARRMATGEIETTWFARHGSTPITDLPDHWPADYCTLVERRIRIIEYNPFISLVERPECKRRWNVEFWQNEEKRALRNWLFNRLESPAYWPETRLVTVRVLAERTAADQEFLQVAERYAGHAGVDIEPLVAELVESESVPALPKQRYKPSGLAKREDWERTWALQRREDEIDAEVAATNLKREDETVQEHVTRLQTEQRRRRQEETGDLAPPPKYRAADFQKPTYWRLRGALDVPKERFVSLPKMSRDNDQTLLVGWAGWNALELCQAVAKHLAEVVEQDGWTASRLTPLLAIIQENLPWLKQWHNDLDPAYNLRLGDFFETYLESQLSIHGLTSDDLHGWSRPSAKQG